MAKPHHPPPSSSRASMLVLVLAALAVAGLVGWALTRTVDVQTTTVASGSDPLAPSTATAPTTTTSASPSGSNPEDGIRRMSVQELKGHVARRDVVVVDVRDAEAYSRGHIPGAVLIPFPRVEGEASVLPRDRPIVTYCA